MTSNVFTHNEAAGSFGGIREGARVVRGLSLPQRAQRRAPRDRTASARTFGAGATGPLSRSRRWQSRVDRLARCPVLGLSPAAPGPLSPLGDARLAQPARVLIGRVAGVSGAAGGRGRGGCNLAVGRRAGRFVALAGWRRRGAELALRGSIEMQSAAAQSAARQLQDLAEWTRRR